MSDETPSRPAPAAGALEEAFWSCVERHALSLQRCKACRHLWYPPGPVCPQCLSEDWSLEPVCGLGRVHAWTVFHRQYFPELPPPYAIVSVEIDEGPLLIGGIRGMTVDQLQVGMRVRACYERAVSKDRGEWVIYQWEPALSPAPPAPAPATRPPAPHLR